MKGKKTKKGIITISMTEIESTKLYFAVNDAVEKLRKLQTEFENIDTLLSLAEILEVLDGLKYNNRYTSVLD